MPTAPSLVAWIERNYRRILAASLGLTVICALSLAQLRLDLDILEMLPQGRPAFDNFKTLVGEFGELNELVILIEGDGVTSPEPFADAFVERLRTLDHVAQVQGRLDPEPIQRELLGRFLYNYVPQAAYADLAKQLNPEGIDDQLKSLRAALSAPFDLSMAQWIRRDPLGLTRRAAESFAAGVHDNNFRLAGGYIASNDGEALLVMVQPTHSAFDIEQTILFMNDVYAAERAARSTLDAPATIRVGYTGSYAFALEDAATLKWDIAKYTIFSLLGVLATFVIGFGNLRIVPFVTLPLLLSTLVTFAASLVVYTQLNAVSICFAALLYGLSMDSAVHYFAYVQQERRLHPLSVAVTRTLSGLGKANVVASVTTAVSFAIIGFSQLKGISQLGSLTGLGMLVNIAEFFLLYPAMTFAMPASTFESRGLDTPGLGKIAQWSANHARSITAATVAFTLLSMWAAVGIGLDVDLTHLRPGGTEAARVQDQIMAKFETNRASGAVLVKAATIDEGLQRAEAVQARLSRYRDEGLLQSIRSITALLPSEHEQRLRLEAWTRLPRTESARWLREALPRHGFAAHAFDQFLERWQGTDRGEILRFDNPALLPLRPLLERYVRIHDRSVFIATYVEPPPEMSLQAIADRLRQDEPGGDIIVAARSLLQDELGATLRSELIWFCLVSFVLNVALVWWSFPRLGPAAAIVIPQATAIVVGLATMRACGIAIDPVNLILVPLVLGIGVDYCIYLAARRQQGASWAASAEHGGRALCVSAISTMAGFGFLGASEYPALARMGIATAFTLLLCLVAAIVVLPALSTAFEPRDERPS